MKKQAIALLLCLLAAFKHTVGAAAVWDAPALSGAEPSSAAVCLVNLDTGTVIYEKEADARRRPASLTKMMTALLFLESGLELATTVTVPEALQEEFDHILADNGADVGIKTGEEMTLESLLYATIIPSANDAATVLAYVMADGDLDAFYDRMNARAAELGCTDTHFICCHGLYETDEGNWSTARDIARIAAACAANPQYMEIASTAESWLPFTNKHDTPKPVPAEVTVPEGMWLQMLNTNVMLHPESEFYRPYIRGIKTGYTDEAAFCLATTAEVEGARYLLVELGSPYYKVGEQQTQQIYQDTAALLDWATTALRVGQAVDETLPLASLPVRYCAEVSSVPVYPQGQITALLDQNAVRYTLNLTQQSLIAPVQAGQTVGTAAVLVNGVEVGTVDLVVKTDCAYSKTEQMKADFRTWWEGVLG